ncbi:hypothetical protein [Kineococcus aurantiacus]|uniref:Uncharacterized protein n=1 Tax=Kineococcus aurantiacus TaxID=37633 RepID=A0A7Y9J2Z3_9ACTN|nr:hypothetical protein [Kineococcus aurantiacus]NYD24665.1 hypothetical protein [Kineococcus aurantiacus]
MSAGGGDVRVTVERLVVETDGAVRADLLAAAFVDELTRLARRRVPPGSRTASARGPHDAVGDPRTEPVRAGRAVAAAVHAALLAEVGRA